MGQIEKIYHGKARIKRKGRGWPGVEDSFPSSSQWGLQVPFWQLPSDPRPFSHFDTATTGFVSYRVISPRQDWWPTRPGWQATAHLYLWDRLLESNKERTNSIFYFFTSEWNLEFFKSSPLLKIDLNIIKIFFSLKIWLHWMYPTVWHASLYFFQKQ